MSTVEKLQIFLATPGDVPTERQYVEDVVNDLNPTVAADKGFVLQVVEWKKGTFPGFGHDAQEIINMQIAEMTKYALFVGIMWNRIGTETPRAESGTVEEFNRAVEAFTRKRQPEIWFYFCRSASTLETPEQIEQRRKVVGFKVELEKNGLTRTYENPTAFREMFRNHMTRWLIARRKPEPDYAAVSEGPAEAIVKYSMSGPIFQHLCGIALLNEYIYHHMDLIQREMYFLKDHGFIKPRSFASLEFHDALNGKNLVELVEPTPIGWLYVKLRREDIPWNMLEDKANLKIDPSAL